MKKNIVFIILLVLALGAITFFLLNKNVEQSSLKVNSIEDCKKILPSIREFCKYEVEPEFVNIENISNFGSLNFSSDLGLRKICSWKYENQTSSAPSLDANFERYQLSFVVYDSNENAKNAEDFAIGSLLFTTTEKAPIGENFYIIQNEQDIGYQGILRKNMGIVRIVDNKLISFEQNFNTQNSPCETNKIKEFIAKI